MDHREFKMLYNTTKKHLHSKAPQLLTTWIDHKVPLDNKSYTDSDSDRFVSSPPVSVLLTKICSISLLGAIVLINKQYGTYLVAYIIHNILKLESNGVRTWGLLKRFRLCSQVRHYNSLLHRALFAGETVYGKRDRRDAVLFSSGIITTIVVIEAVFTHYHHNLSVSSRLVLILCWIKLIQRPETIPRYINSVTRGLNVMFTIRIYQL